jgi:hypothetical protein
MGPLGDTFPALDLEMANASTLSVGRATTHPEMIVPLRLTFGAGPTQVVYEYLKFRRTRSGRKEAELVSDGREPFTLTLLLRAETGTFTFHEHTAGFSIRAGHKYIRALQALTQNPHVEVHNLESGNRLFSARLGCQDPRGSLSPYSRFFETTSRICDYFKVDLQMNRSITPADAEGLTLLEGLMEGTLVSLGPITASIVKTEAAAGPNWERVWAGGTTDLVLNHEGLQIPVLESLVSTGPFAFNMTVRAADPTRFKHYWQAAAEGALIDVRWVPEGSATVIRDKAVNVNLKFPKSPK